ncbi:DUF2203 domain-containing protein [Brevibacillus dissolubilis]|uniref:DUF2203 domain-containing protein n=1 Tax=Brevibacillus dissolubilis TaxID=1844116 RepID=UPI001116D087|nr:DUF2203 domain-containing protein [Brevibacillus dissolubilis]
MEKKIFTLDEANELLPYVKEELSFLKKSKKEFQQKYQELQEFLHQNRYHEHSQSYRDYVFEAECSLEFIELEFKMHLNSVQSKGIQIKEIDYGLVDFPAVIDGEEVLLCWREGEEAVSYYHGLYDGFAGRKSLD